MKKIALKRLATREDANKLKSTWLTSCHIKFHVNGDVEIRDRDTNRLVLFVTRLITPRNIWQPADELLITVNKPPSNRGLAVAGSGAMMPGITKDLHLSERNRIDEDVLNAAGNPMSDFVGYFDRGEKGEPWCRETEWTLSHPEVFGPAVQDFMRFVSGVYQFYLPEEYAIQAQRSPKFRHTWWCPELCGRRSPTTRTFAPLHTEIPAI
jgi:hypothetical protein